MVSDSSGYARALRAVAFVVAGAAALWEVVSPQTPEDTQPTLLGLRLGTGAVALAIGLASTTRRTPHTLSVLAFVLATVIVAGNGVAAALGAGFPFERAAVLAVMMLAAALFLPWTPRGQAALAIPAALSYAVVELLVAPRAPAPAVLARGGLLVATAAVASVLGARLADRTRRQIARAEADRRARDQQQSQERRLDAVARLAGGMAHQFNNLLAGILTHVEVLRHEAAGAAGGAQAGTAELAEIAEAAKRGRDLTEELMRFTRSDPLRLAPTDTARTLASIERLARAVLPVGTVVELVVPSPPEAELPPITADLDHLIHAAMQLALNARDAMRGRPSPRLVVSAAVETVAAGDAQWPDVAPGRYVRISLADAGRGMDAAMLERVFEPFFTTRPLHQATGLGLAIVHRVMRDHQGAVRIRSQPDRGTTVDLLLPVAADAPATAAPGRSTPAAVPAPPVAATILIVDDEPIVRSSLRRALTRFGHRVLEAGDGPTALNALQAADPPVDLVILDLVLPGGGAGIFELLKSVRPDVKVIVSSGYSPDGEASRGLASRVEGFLPKPYELPELRDAVLRALGRA